MALHLFHADGKNHTWYTYLVLVVLFVQHVCCVVDGVALKRRYALVWCCQMIGGVGMPVEHHSTVSNHVQHIPDTFNLALVWL